MLNKRIPTELTDLLCDGINLDGCKFIDEENFEWEFENTFDENEEGKIICEDLMASELIILED